MKTPTLYIVNSFSINMLSNILSDGKSHSITFHPIQPWTLECLIMSDKINVVNAIGHADTAYIVAKQFELDGISLPEAQRVNVNIGENDNLIIAQYIGPRLPEGCTKLPEGAEIKYFSVEF